MPASVTQPPSSTPDTTEVVNNTTAADAASTTTPDWRCIRTWESGDRYGIYSGAYGFEGMDAGAMSPTAQDAYALHLFHENGDHFSGTWNDKCTEEYGLR